MIRTIGKFLALPADDRRFLILAIVTLPLVGAALRLASSRRCLDALERFTPRVALGPTSSLDSHQRSARAAWLVSVASRLPPAGPNCLARSITLWWLLRRHGISASVRIGVRRRLGRLEAHAWVEHLGHVLDDDADVADRFAPFDSLEALFPPPGAGVR